MFLKFFFQEYGDTCRVRAAKLSKVSKEECGKKYKLKKGQICAGHSERDSCNGDSGGPLIDNTRRCQYGVVSYGWYCGTSSAVYTEIKDYVEFIRNACELNPKNYNKSNIMYIIKHGIYN